LRECVHAPRWRRLVSVFLGPTAPRPQEPRQTTRASANATAGINLLELPVCNFPFPFTNFSSSLLRLPALANLPLCLSSSASPGSHQSERPAATSPSYLQTLSAAPSRQQRRPQRAYSSSTVGVPARARKCTHLSLTPLQDHYVRMPILRAAHMSSSSWAGLFSQPAHSRARSKAFPSLEILRLTPHASLLGP
jgi:hypothetical protein